MAYSPEGLTEPTVSGVIFQRQAQLRWSQSLTPQLTYHGAIEDPNSSDVFGDEPALNRTPVLDGVAGIEYDAEGFGACGSTASCDGSRWTPPTAGKHRTQLGERP